MLQDVAGCRLKAFAKRRILECWHAFILHRLAVLGVCFFDLGLEMRCDLLDPRRNSPPSSCGRTSWPTSAGTSDTKTTRPAICCPQYPQHVTFWVMSKIIIKHLDAKIHLDPSRCTSEQGPTAKPTVVSYSWPPLSTPSRMVLPRRVFLALEEVCPL